MVMLLMFSVPAVHGATWNSAASIQFSETWSDNIALAGAGQERHEFVTDISPSLLVGVSGGRSSLSLQASLHALQYAQGSSANRMDQTLNSNGKLEILDKWLFVDGSAMISQQNISPFAGQNTNLVNISGNRSTLRSYAYAPYITGTLGNSLTYNLRYQTTQTGGGTTPGNGGRAFTGSLAWRNSSNLLSIGLDFGGGVSSYSNQENTTSRSSRITTSLNVDPMLSFSAFAGREQNNYSLTSLSALTTGASMRWALSDRTSLNLTREYHATGPTALVSFNHRMPRSTLQLTYSQTSNTTSTQGALNAPSQDYQNFFQICTALALSTQCPAWTLQQLALLGLTAYAQLPFVSNAAYLQRNLQGSLLLTGVRNTVTLSASSSSSRNDSALLAGSDILASNSSISQQNISLNWASRVTAFSNLSANFSRNHSASPGLAANDTVSQTIFLLWTSQLSQKLMGSITMRHATNTVALGGGIPYRENAMTATLGYSY